MNPLTNVKNLQKVNEKELELGLVGKKSWHDKYKDSAWIFTGGLPYDLTEGDVICVFSQYGEIVNINLVRDKKTGKFKGYGFLCYEDQRSTILSVDNLNGAKILGRTIRVDHVENYKQPKEFGDEDALTQQIRAEGCAPKLSGSEEESGEEDYVVPLKKVKKEKKSKKKKKEKKKKHKKSESSESSEEDVPKVKKEKIDSNHQRVYDREEKYRSHKQISDNGKPNRDYKDRNYIENRDQDGNRYRGYENNSKRLDFQSKRDEDRDRKKDHSTYRGDNRDRSSYKSRDYYDRERKRSRSPHRRERERSQERRHSPSRKDRTRDR